MEEIEELDSGEVREMAARLEQTGALTFAQGEVYVLREIMGVGRQGASMLTEKPPNTVDNLYARSREKVENSRELVETLEEFREEFA